MPERTIFQAMTRRHVLSLGPTATAHEAACLMTRTSCTSVLVIDHGSQLLGIVTDRDLMTRVLAKELDPMHLPLSKIMTPQPQCVAPEMKVADAVLIMLDRGFHHLPVAAPNGKVLGVFTVTDALPREVNTAVSLSEFNEQVNDALG